MKVPILLAALISALLAPMAHAEAFKVLFVPIKESNVEKADILRIESMLNKWGALDWALTTATPMKDVSGAIYGFVFVLTNMQPFPQEPR